MWYQRCSETSVFGILLPDMNGCRNDRGREMLENSIFSREYRSMVALLKKIMRGDTKDEERMSDFRTSEGSGRKGPTSLSGGIPESGYLGRVTRAKPRQINRKEEEDRNAEAIAPVDGEI